MARIRSTRKSILILRFAGDFESAERDLIEDRSRMLFDSHFRIGTRLCQAKPLEMLTEESGPESRRVSRICCG